MTVERGIKVSGLVFLWLTLTTLLWGVWRGTKRKVGSSTGRQPSNTRTPAFYALVSVAYFSFCAWLWRPIALHLSRPVRALFSLFGILLYFPGLALVLWGRLTLADMYNVSSSLGAELYAGHRLVTHGPFALVRHPMYLGIFLTGLGGLLLYRTWTFFFLLLHLPALLLRARREEAALSLEFGPEWAAYCAEVPGWWPTLSGKPNHLIQGFKNVKGKPADE